MRKMTILLASAMPMLLGPARAFALAATLDSIDDLPDEIKAEYAQGADGKRGAGKSSSENESAGAHNLDSCG